MAYLRDEDYIFCGGRDVLPIGETRLTLDPEHTCCFTGHRPERLPQGEGLEKLRERAGLFIRILAEQGADTFITGMARGFDLLAAELLLDDPTLSDVRLICAIPYKGQFSEMRTLYEKKLYQRLLDTSAARVYFFESYARQCYFVRNSFMTNYSSHVLGYLKDEDTRSGTYQTVNMARKLGLDTILIRERDIL